MDLRAPARGRTNAKRRDGRVGSRAVSSTLDTVLFVLLVGTAVVALTGIEAADRTHADRGATETTDLLATSTATVEYERTAEVQHGLLGMREERTVRAERTASGTYAQLLAAAVVADARVDGRSLTGSDGELATAVREELDGILPHGGRRTHVRAVWRPYPGVPIGNAVSAGAEPPNGTDVDAATLTVPSGLPEDEEAARVAATRGFDGLASTVAADVIEGLFTPREMRVAMRSDGPDRPLLVERYDSAGGALGVETRPAIERREVEAASARLRRTLADRLRRDLRRRYSSPADAAGSVRTGSVRITVRTWSP